MTEDPRVPNPFEPAGDAGPQDGPSQPPESGMPSAESTGPDDSIEKKVTGSLKRGTGALRPRTKARDDYVSELRQTLAAEDAAPRETGGLIRRITGTLRKVTGPLRRGTGELPPLPPTPEPPAPVVSGQDLADSFMSDRLSGSPSTAPEEEETPPEEEFVFGEVLPPEPLAEFDFSFEEPQEAPLVETPLFSDEPALDHPAHEEQEAQPAGGPPSGEDSDWVSEIRQEAAAQDEGVPAEPPTQPEAAPPARASGRLRAIITGILGRRKEAPSEEISDDLVTGRLERSLGGEPQPPRAEETASLDDLYAENPSEPLRGAAALGDDFDMSFADMPEAAVPAAPEAPLFASGDDDLLAGAELEEDALFPDALADRLGGLTGEPAAPPPAEIFTPEITPEDEALIWGDSAPDAGEEPQEELTFKPEDLWAEVDEPEGAADRRSAGLSADDLYAAQYLTGELMMPGQPAGPSQDNLLREALSGSTSEGEPVTGDSAMADLRAIALEDYDQAAVDRLGTVQAAGAAAAPAGQFDDAYLEAYGEKPRARGGMVVLRALLIVLSVLALAAVALLVYMYNRPPVYQVGYLIPRPLPANLPYPTGVVLPGGWGFPLEKSTFVEGQWKPAGSEWLEGTELRRVVALPWNPQTEAVIRTFKPGDQVLLDLSNNDTVDYTVTEVKRIPRDDTQILDERRPSLVVILYQENAEERWVVFCKP